MEKKITFDREAVEYIAKLANGGMRDAITMLDKCLAYSTELTLDNVIQALGLASYDVMLRLFRAYFDYDHKARLEIINEVYMSGKDLKLFIKEFTNFIIDFNKYRLKVTQYLNCPLTEDIKKTFDEYVGTFGEVSEVVLEHLIKLQAEIKWDTNPKARIEAWCITGE